ncbi:MAG TPA: hypothetical protein VFM96_16005 [Gaiellaceae bacterium]|nr:hypothetical protein [Gaiellaceae bacterium]
MASPEQPRWCPNCGAGYEPLQEYCLECGERLPTTRSVVGLLAAAWQRRLPWYPGDWIWPVVLFFVLTVVSTAAAVAAASTKSSPTVVATLPGVTVGPGATTAATTPTATLPPAPRPTITTGPLPTAPGLTTAAPATTAPPVTTAPPATAPPTVAGGWPTGHSGYTNVLQSIPTSAGRVRADAKARAAAAAGLPQVGVLDSSQHSSLHGGYYVVFSGVYSSPTQAAAALTSVHARGFPDAYEARVTP